MPTYFVIIKYISGIYLFLIGLFIVTNSNLKNHPYSLIAIACFTESAFAIHYIMPTLLFSVINLQEKPKLLYYLLSPVGIFTNFSNV